MLKIIIINQVYQFIGEYLIWPSFVLITIAEVKFKYFTRNVVYFKIIITTNLYISNN